MTHNPPQTTPFRIAVFASGTGTDLQSILDRTADGSIDGQVVLVISNNAKAMALDRARDAGAKAAHWSEKQAGSHEAFVRGLLDLLAEAKTDLVVLAGYMKLIPEQVVNAYQGRMLNVHPGLLPKFGGKGFYGMRVHEAVIAAGETESGATVHFVDPIYDHGAVFMQRSVPVLPDDTPESLRDRVLELEHQLLPDAVSEYVTIFRRTGAPPIPATADHVEKGTSE